ncbi:MAG: type II secretion system protein [Phycisphaerales bacterium]|nr:hypothetical protein [Phycisphaerae bacterium]NNF43808.1 type II secretion system protein [Phycisphaerales bacterium]NNM27206.1 type II secretion system protein [Phycisphaerales bacterium]
MRILIRMLLAVMILGITTGILLYYLNVRRDASDRELARAEVNRFQQQIYLRAALASPDQQDAPPPVIDPSWFQENLPINPLLGTERPWVEVAAAHDKTRLHPHNLTAGSDEIAAFWYNPANGVVRARVPEGISDSQALALYNEVNDCGLGSLFPTP